MNYSELLNDINAAIYENNDQEIDALEVRAILREMVTSLGSGFLFKGIATPSSPSGTGTYEPDQNVFYLATTAGTYTYLGGLVVAAGEVAFLCFDGTWTKKSSALLSTGSIVDNTTTEDATKPLSAKQGKVLADAGAATAAEVSALGQRFATYNSAVDAFVLDKRNEIWPAFALDAKYKLMENVIYTNWIKPTLGFCPKTYPSIMWGKKEFAFTKGTTTPVQVKAAKTFVIRELSDLHFEGWIKFGDKIGSISKTQAIELQFKKQYPATGNETIVKFSIRENTDYSNVATTPITDTISNAVIGNISITFDDYRSGADGWFVHFYINKDFGGVRYANLHIVYYNDDSWISANGSVYMSSSLIDPIVTSTRAYEPGGYEDAENSAFDAFVNNNYNSGNYGKPLDNPTKLLLTPVHGPFPYSVQNNGKSFDISFADEGGIAFTSQSDLLFYALPKYYYKQFPSGKFYIQFALDFDTLQKCTGANSGLYTSRQIIMDCRWALTPGAKIGNSNDYANNQWRVVDVTEDGRFTIRIVVDTPADGAAWGSEELNFLLKSANVTDITEATFYDLCISDKPLAVGGDHRGRVGVEYPNIVGKSLMLFGDSEHNTNECLFDTAMKLGLLAYDCHLGGRTFGWSANWLYDWSLRQYTIATQADFYIFCASTNDLSDVVAREQLATDASIQAVKDNYPVYGDSSAQISAKMALYNAMTDSEKKDVFNMTSVLCAYIEQILDNYPQAKIILANCPITCTGLLTGNLSANNRGEWATGVTPNSARSVRDSYFAKLDECMHTIAERYNLPVLDFWNGVGLTFNNFLEYCQDGTHWNLDDQTYIDGTVSVLRNHHKILVREGEMLTDYLLTKGA